MADDKLKAIKKAFKANDKEASELYFYYLEMDSQAQKVLSNKRLLEKISEKDKASWEKHLLTEKEKDLILSWKPKTEAGKAWKEWYDKAFWRYERKHGKEEAENPLPAIFKEAAKAETPAEFSNELDEIRPEVLKLRDNYGPPALDPEPILEISGRGDPNGYIAFTAKNDEGEMKNITAVKVKDVREWLPGILSQFVKYDGYYSVNPYYRPGRSRKNYPEGFKWPVRKEKMLTELAVCYADLDIGRPDTIGFEEGQIQALKLQKEGMIPPFSIMACSGRGMYLFWLLCNKDNREQLPPAYEINRIRYKKINKALHKRLTGLEVDNIHDPTRVLRIPGSIHRKTLKRVTYSITFQGTEGGRLTYTLNELEGFLNIDSAAKSLPGDIREKAKPQIYTRTYKKAQRRVPENLRGYHRLNELRAKDLETIEQWRGGFIHGGDSYPDGFKSPGRCLMLSLYAQWLKGADERKASVFEAVKTMAGNCKPPYPSDPNDPPLKKIINNAFSNDPKKHFKNVKTTKLLKWLGINKNTDPDLLEELHSILPPEIKELRDNDLYKQKDFTKDRRDLIRQHIILTKKIPSLRKMAKILENRGSINPSTGKRWSYEVIRADYKAINTEKLLKKHSGYKKK